MMILDAANSRKIIRAKIVQAVVGYILLTLGTFASFFGLIYFIFHIEDANILAWAITLMAVILVSGKITWNSSEKI
jgi:hypothetical protein